MKNYQKGGRGDSKDGGFRGERKEGGAGRPAFQKKSWGNDRGGDRETTMYKAVCSECKKSCDVPFRPSGDKPVYCRDCFAGKREGDDRGSRPSGMGHEPKRFSNDRPAPRADSARTEVRQTPNDDQTKKQLSDISFKLDKLITAIEKMSVNKKEIVAPTPVVAAVKVIATEVKKVAVSKKIPAVKKVAEKKLVEKKVVVKKKTAKAAVKKTK